MPPKSCKIRTRNSKTHPKVQRYRSKTHYKANDYIYLTRSR